MTGVNGFDEKNLFFNKNNGVGKTDGLNGGTQRADNTAAPEKPVIDFTNKNINLNNDAGNIYGRMGVQFNSPYAYLNDKYPALQNYLNAATPEVRGRIGNDVNATFLALEEADA